MREGDRAAAGGAAAPVPIAAAGPVRGERRIAVPVALIGGLAIVTVLVAWYGWSAVGALVWTAGWGIVAITAFHVLPIALAACAWRTLMGREVSEPTGVLVLLRWIRNSVNGLLPAARVGGDVVGVRLLVLRSVKASAAAAGIVADKTVEVLAQLLFAGIGLLLLIQAGDGRAFRQPALLGLAVMVVAIGGFVVAQRWGLLRLTERLVAMLAGSLGATLRLEIGGLHDAVWRIYRNRRRVLLALLFHTLAWTCGAVEIWLALGFMGHPIGLIDALVVESLVQAVASAAFLMPAALGAQEATYILLAGLFGLAPEVGLALSLVRRASDLLRGLPGLACWQWLEGRHLRLQLSKG